MPRRRLPSPVPAPVERDRRVSLGVVSGVVAATGKLAPYAAVGAGLRVRVVGPLGIEVRGLAPIGSQSIAGPRGPIDLSVWLAGGGLVFAPRLAPLGFELGAGALAVVLRGTGTDGMGAEGRTDQAFGIALYGRAAGRLQLSPAWAVRLDCWGEAPRPSVRTSGSTRKSADGHVLGRRLRGGAGRHRSLVLTKTGAPRLARPALTPALSQREREI